MTEATPLASEQITQEAEAKAIKLWNAAWDAQPNGIHAYNRARIAGINALAAALSASPAPSGQGVSGERLRNAAENLLIAIGMGWDLDGVISETEAALAAPAPSCAPGGVERLTKGAFVTSTSGGGNYVVTLRYETLAEMQAAHATLVGAAALSPQRLDAKEGGE